jgi:hypothetical protein
MKNIFFGVILLLVLSNTALTQEIPQGVRYKKASDDINQKAKAVLEKAFSRQVSADANVPISEKSAVICGPFLWEAIGNPDVFKGATPVSLMINDKVAQGRGIRDEAQQRTLWDRILKRTAAMGPVKIRKPEPSEIAFFWAMIPFDIEEPLLIADFGKERMIFNFLVKDGKPTIMWIDIVGDLKSLK